MTGSRMDDPIFDPWGPADEEGRPPRQRGSRWRSAGASSPGASRVQPTPPKPKTLPEDDRAVQETPSDRATLRDIIAPSVEAISGRLVGAGHETTVDDRLDQDPPSYRFRVVPWLGPFDDREAQPAAVLELAVERERPESVVGRIWLDPYSTEATAERSIGRETLTPAWVERLALDLVEAVLGRRRTPDTRRSVDH